MSGTVCLQGGAEFGADCVDMDRALLAADPGPVVVSALAGTVGSDYATASARGVQHFQALGATDVVAAPDVREDRESALAVLRTARLLVLPGGSPSRLLAALTTTGADGVVQELLAAGGTVMGASAGAMVLCGWTVLPDRGRPQVTRGLGALPALLVVPHWTPGDRRPDWLAAIRAGVPDDVQILGLPEQSGVVVASDGTITAVGRTATRLVSADRDLAVGSTWRPV